MVKTRALTQEETEELLSRIPDFTELKEYARKAMKEYEEEKKNKKPDLSC